MKKYWAGRRKNGREEKREDLRLEHPSVARFGAFPAHCGAKMGHNLVTPVASRGKSASWADGPGRDGTAC